MVSTGVFRTSVWDPTLIIGQIICLQSAFYSSESALLFLWSFSGYTPSLAEIFAYEPSKPMVFIQLISSIFCSFILLVLVGRARQCLDFSITLHFLHFIAVCFYNRTIPTLWLLQIISCTICTIFGEWLCLKRECTEIPLSQSNKEINSFNDLSTTSKDDKKT
ncbi:hypothetical protein Mgra_00006650 [Meloidogyne graminicola]|uniref:Protein SYS1 homolog n=1 Tax=Meloidogyne graminicola TaxID=189291 RepID=A0A8S9ZKV7_9BILA|nr:hypothetical protein Mgra_00006650 [Meloidogyne graminicola]